MGKTVVVPFGTPDAKLGLSPADTLEGELLRRRVHVISMHEARDRFTVRSRTPLTASDSDLDVLAKQAREAIQHVAFGRTAAAQKSVREVIVRAERTLESLNRETARARQILDACLSLVRGSLHDNMREEALDQAMRCRRLVPDLAPSEAAHPPNVIGVLAEADDLLRRMRTGKLTVTSQPQSDCSVYLNGRHLGTTPFVLDRAASGEYRVQVECGAGRLGRVHTVQLGDEPMSMTVDTALDRAVFSDPRLWLSYETERALRKFLVEHATTIGREVRAEDVVLLRIEGSSAELARVRVQQGRLVARARVDFRPGGFERASLAKGLAALAEGRIEAEPLGVLEPEPEPPPSLAVDPQSARLQATAEPQAPRVEPATAAPGFPSWRRRTGYALTGFAVAAFGVGLGLELWAQSLRNDLLHSNTGDVPLDGQQERYDRVFGASWIGVATAPLGVVATVLLVEPRKEVPWWSWTLGVVGLGAAGFGIYEAAISQQCALGSEEGGTCLRHENTVSRGVTLLSAAAPLISVPILHLVRRSQLNATASMDVRQGGAFLRLHGRF